MSYKPYSKRKTPVFTDTTASDLFDELLSGKPLKNQASNQPPLTATKAKQRLNVRGGVVPHGPEECSPPKVFKGGTQETRVEKGVSSWSRRKHEYSFSPRVKTSKASSVRTTKPQPSCRISVFDVIDGEEEETSPPQKLPVKSSSKLPVSQSPPKLQKTSAPKPKGTNTVTKVPVEPKTVFRSGAKSSSASSLPMKTTVQSDSRTRVAKSKKEAPKSNTNNIFLGPLADSDTKSSPSSCENSQESSSGVSAHRFRESPRKTVFSVEKQKSANDNDDSVWVSAEVQDSQDSDPHTAHTLTQSTSPSSSATSTGFTNTRRAKRLNSTNNKTSTSSKRPRIGSTEQSKDGSKVRGQRSNRGKGIVSEIATRTRSSSRAEEVVKSPLDELLESPVKKPCVSPSSLKETKNERDKDSTRDYSASLYRPAIKVASPIKQTASSQSTNVTDQRVKSKAGKDHLTNNSKPEVPSLKKSSSYPRTLTVPSVTRTTSWPRQYSLLSSTHATQPTDNKPVASSLTVPKDGGVSTSSAKSPRKYSFFKQQSSSDGTKDEARPQRQYSYMHTVVSTPGDGARSGPGDSVRSGAGDGVKRGVGVSGKGGADNTPTTTQEPTRVRNVRQAHECLEVGENQEFFDEVRYLLGSIKPSAPLKSRCLGTLNLAEQFLKSGFSQQLRSQGFTSKIMTLLKDCLQYPTLCLCTAVLFYTITRDKLNSEWTKDGINILYSMLSMTSWTLDSDPKTEREMLRMRQKAKTILRKTVTTHTVNKGDDLAEGSQEEREGKVQSSEPPEFEIDVENFTISELARETLTSLTAPQHKPKALGNQLRIVGALDQLANMVIEGSDDLPGVGSTPLLSGCGLEPDVERQLMTLDRSLKVLENCTLLNQDNQSYLVVFDGSVLVSRLVKLIKMCYRLLPSADHTHSSQIPCYALLSVFKLLLNLTHNNELSCDRVGGEEGVMDVLLDCVLMLPDSLSEGQQFDIMAPALGVLINLTEHSSRNRRQLELTKVKGQGGGRDEVDELLMVQKDIGFHGNDSSLRALVELFLKHYRKAESASIVVPSPQRLSQLSSSPHPSPKRVGNHGNKGQGAATARRDLSVTFANRLKATRSPQKGSSQNSQSSQDQNSQNSQSSDGLGWLPSNSAESDQSEEEEEEYETIQTDPMVYSREEFDTALHQAGRHLEDSVVASYTALLIGILVKHNCDCVELVRGCLPSGSFSEMTGMLRKFVSFMNMTGSTTGLDSMRHIIRYLQEF